MCVVCSPLRKGLADAKRAAIVSKIVIPTKTAFTPAYVTCYHEQWFLLSSDAIRSVSCDLGYPLHIISSGLAWSCHNCHIMACMTCGGGG